MMRGLELRGLAVTRRWYGKWGAELLPAGAHYLRHGTYPDPASVKPRAKERPTTSPRERPSPSVDRAAAGPATRVKRSGPPPLAKKINGSQQLINDIVAAGGTLRVQHDAYDEKARASLATRIRIARSRGYVPDGKQLKERSVERGVTELCLVDPPAWLTEHLPPIRVGRSLDDPHPVIRALRDSQELLPIADRTVRNRALRLAQALVTAATAKQYKVAAVRQQNNWNHRTGRDRPGQVRFTVDGHDLEVRISPILDKVEHKPTADERRWNQQYGTRYPKWDHVPSKRLQIEMPGLFVHRTSSWADSATAKLEGLLPQVIQEMRLRAEGAERDRIKREEARTKAIAEHEAMVAAATERFHEACRVDELDRQMKAWTRAREARDYIAAMRARQAEMTDPEEREAAQEWLDWAAAHVELINPLRTSLKMPAQQKPGYTDLQPFMPRGASPYSVY